jgi:hypothetical protein
MEISNLQLKNSLIKLRIDTFLISEMQTYCLTDLFNTGCRYNELLESFRVQEYDLLNYIIITEKESANRIILKSRFTNFFNDNWTPESTSFEYCRFSTCQRLIRNNLIYKNVKVSSHPISTHLFRYNYARMLFDDGKTYEEIGLDMGIIDINNVKGYVHNIITGDEI